jgi:hypothetical protein
MTDILANIPADQVGIIIGAVITALLGGGYIGKKVGESKMEVGPQPFSVELRKEFLTRADHDTYRAEVRADFIRMESNINRMADRVDNKHLELLATIERAAKIGLDGRVALWKELKPMGHELAALRATSNVADQLAKLADTLEKTHGKTPSK